MCTFFVLFCLTIPNAGFHQNFDLVTNEDGGYMEVIIIYLQVAQNKSIYSIDRLLLRIANSLICSLDLMSSPNNPLNKIMLERTAVSYLIIYLVNHCLSQIMM